MRSLLVFALASLALSAAPARADDAATISVEVVEDTPSADPGS